MPGYVPQPESAVSPLEGGGLQRTDLHCHACDGTFVAELDFDINGKHVVECPSCGHEHCRVITDGKITSERWDGRNLPSDIRYDRRSVWKSSVLQAQTSTVAAHIRERWLNRSDFNGD